jgi:membrane protein implicated in regulation of membrane protease activity
MMTPESLLVLLLLALISALGAFWQPLLVALPALVVGSAAVIGHAITASWRAIRAVPERSRRELVKRRALTSLLMLLQPAARLTGRLRKGLSPWRRRLRPAAAFPRPRVVNVWNESWVDPQMRLQALQDAFAASGGLVRSGGPFDRWDLELRAGPLGGVKIRTAVEEHGGGKQMLKAKIWPRASAAAITVLAGLLAISLYAWLGGRPGIAIAAAAGAVVGLALAIEGTGSAMRLALVELDRRERSSRRGAEATHNGRRAPLEDLPVPRKLAADDGVGHRRQPIGVSEELEELRR